MPEVAGNLFDVMRVASPTDVQATNGILYSSPNEIGGSDPYLKFIRRWKQTYPKVPNPTSTMFYIDCVFAVARGLLQVPC
jgi:hypothetical protein